jgi:hypothetical protein
LNRAARRALLKEQEAASGDGAEGNITATTTTTTTTTTDKKGGTKQGENGGSSGGGKGRDEIIFVPLSMVGLVIGQGGKTIKALQQKSGAKIQVSKDKTNSAGDREVRSALRSPLSQAL